MMMATEQQALTRLLESKTILSKSTVSLQKSLNLQRVLFPQQFVGSCPHNNDHEQQPPHSPWWSSYLQDGNGSSVLFHVSGFLSGG